MYYLLFWNYCLLMLICISRTSHEQDKLPNKDAVVELQLSTKVSHIQSSQRYILSSTCTTLHKWTQQCVIVSKTVLFPSVDFFAELCISGKAVLQSGPIWSNLFQSGPIWSNLHKWTQQCVIVSKTVLCSSVDFFAELCISSLINLTYYKQILFTY